MTELEKLDAGLEYDFWDAGVNGRKLRAIENGNHGCTIALLLDISSFFDVSTDYLLTGRSFEALHIQKQLSAAQDILAGIMKDLKSNG